MIGELAQVARCAVGTVRYYETKGVLAEPKPERHTHLA